MDVVVTVPKRRWEEWLMEGALPGEIHVPVIDVLKGEEVDPEYGFAFGPGSAIPDIDPGERVYVVAHGKLRGYAPLAYIDIQNPERFGRPNARFALVRKGGAVAVTIDQPIRGFQNWRYRWWMLQDERPFPDWEAP